ncbi:hypothetical protein H5410_005048 [Solanum commersonii]|uniref:Uncharacterized protein n=1 Tax=Solanum commersonii TaxID=4109 RepID=A0A9J6A5C9_SOLCO|nr:hypothetical protein H5410_005048 [Solanum commersonii]
MKHCTEQKNYFRNRSTDEALEMLEKASKGGHKVATYRTWDIDDWPDESNARTKNSNKGMSTTSSRNLRHNLYL